MGVSYNNDAIVTDGLIFCTDAANIKSLRDTVTVNSSWHDIIGNVEGVASLNPNFIYQPDSKSILDNSPSGYYDYGPTNAITGNYKNEFTMSVWVNFTQTARGYIFNAKRSATASSWFGIVVNTEDNGLGESTGDVGLIYSIGSTGGNNNAGHYFVCTVGGNYNDGKWYNIAATFGPGGAFVYIDGELKNSRITDGLAAYTGNTGPLSIGSFSNNNSTANFIGKIARTEMYDKVLTLEEIQQNYNATKGRFKL